MAPHRLRALGLLLPLLLAPGTARGAPAGEKELRGKRVTLAEPPHSQLAGGHPVHPAGREIRFGGTVFPLAAEGGRLRAAAAPGGPPAVEVLPGKPVRFEWSEEAGKRSVLLSFAKDDAGAWSYYASEAVRFQVGGEDFRLYDGDADGRYGDLAKDGWGTGEGDQVIPLAKEISLGANRVALKTVDPDGGRIVVEVAALAGTKIQVATVVSINRLRAANAIPPVVLDEKLSAACTSHANYLATNGWTGRTSPHEQSLGPRGASPEGAEAARRSIVASMAPDTAVEHFWRTYFHRIGLMSPYLDRIGVNAEPASLAVVDVARGYVGAVGGTEVKEDTPWADPSLVPSDGSVGIPTAANPELPSEPVPSLGSRGIPLMALFLPTTAARGFGGTLEELRGGTAAKVPVLVADPGQYPVAQGLVPEKTLHAKTWYRATYTWTVDGKPRKRTVRFRTE